MEQRNFTDRDYTNGNSSERFTKLRNRAQPTQPERANTNIETAADTEDILDTGILYALELKVRENLAKRDLDETTIKQIVEEIVTHRHEKIKAINAVVKILSQTKDGKQLDNTFYREVYQIIDDTKTRLHDLQYFKLILNRMSSFRFNQTVNETPEEQLTSLYLYYNLCANAALANQGLPEDQIAYFIKNYNKYISFVSVDEWRDERFVPTPIEKTDSEKKVAKLKLFTDSRNTGVLVKSSTIPKERLKILTNSLSIDDNTNTASKITLEDENSVSSVEGARFSTVIKLAESIAQKLISGVKLVDMKDLLRAAVFIDNLAEDPQNITKEDRENIALHLQYALTNIVTDFGLSEYPNMEHNIYASGYPDIKLFVEYIASKLMEIQIYTKQTVVNKKLEEAAGLYGKRKEILGQFNQYLEQNGITAINSLSSDSDEIKTFMQNILAYTIPMQAGGKIFLTISQKINQDTRKLLIQIIKNIEVEIEAKSLDRKEIFNQISFMVQDYSSLLIDSKDYFQVGATFKDKDEIAEMNSQYSEALRQKLQINVYE